MGPISCCTVHGYSFLSTCSLCEQTAPQNVGGSNLGPATFDDEEKDWLKVVIEGLTRQLNNAKACGEHPGMSCVEAHEAAKVEIERLHADRRALADAETKQVEEFLGHQISLLQKNLSEATAQRDEAVLQRQKDMGNAISVCADLEQKLKQSEKAHAEEMARRNSWCIKNYHEENERICKDLAEAIAMRDEAVKRATIADAKAKNWADCAEENARDYARNEKRHAEEVAAKDAECERTIESLIDTQVEELKHELAQTKAALEEKEREISECQALLDAEPWQIIRNEKDGYPEGRPDRLLTFTERLKALDRYASDYRGWFYEKEKKCAALQAEKEAYRQLAMEYRIRDMDLPGSRSYTSPACIQALRELVDDDAQKILKATPAPKESNDMCVCGHEQEVCMGKPSPSQGEKP